MLRNISTPLLLLCSRKYCLYCDFEFDTARVIFNSSAFPHNIFYPDRGNHAVLHPPALKDFYVCIRQRVAEAIVGPKALSQGSEIEQQPWRWPTLLHNSHRQAVATHFSHWLSPPPPQELQHRRRWDTAGPAPVPSAWGSQEDQGGVSLPTPWPHHPVSMLIKQAIAPSYTKVRAAHSACAEMHGCGVYVKPGRTIMSGDFCSSAVNIADAQSSY